MHSILIAEDESEIRNYLKLALSCQGFTTEFAQNGDEVLTKIRAGQSYALVLLDVFMPLRDGMETLKEVRRIRPDLPVVMMSAAATPCNVVTAMNHGARDFLGKPISHDDLRKAVEKALDISLPVKACATSASEEYMASGGTWSQKNELLLDRIGSSDVSVLLRGETGVGKEVIARKLHARSRRANRPFLKLNCAALPSELVESELFGYEKGAFTGAFKNTPGKFEMASGGTILLDEIGDMDYKLQAKLLQVIQDREFLPLGAKEMSRVDVRIMAASHCDFDAAIQEKRFREDLYYRLNIVEIEIPPLRERRDEIIPLAEFFLQKHTTGANPVLEITPGLAQVLLDHTWPGNVRELENIIQKYLVLRNSSLLTEEIKRRSRKGSVIMNIAAVPIHVRHPQGLDSLDQDIKAPWIPGTVSSSVGATLPDQVKEPGEIPSAVFFDRTLPSDAISPLSKVEDARRAGEVEAILNALNSSLWNRKQAAALLNIDYKALLYKMKKLGIGDKKMAVAS